MLRIVTVSGCVLLALTACADRRESGQYQLDPDYQGPGLPWFGGAGAVTSSDTDGDGLSDDEEESLGLDPNAADTDGDSYEDKLEIDGLTDPLDETDHPYAGGWPIGACRDDLVASGNSPGQVTANFALMDQNGDTVRLHDFCDRAVLMVSGAMWCGPCNDEAPDMQALYAQYQAEGLMVITLLGENNSSSTPSQADLMDWATTHGLSHPVVADAGWAVSDRWGASAIPTMHLLAAGAVVVRGDSWISETEITASLP